MPDNDLPFSKYPGGGRQLIGRVKGSNCRRGYGLQHQRLTGQLCCGYCGLPLTERYEYWLTMALDHVIPHKESLSLGIPPEWYDDSSNKLLTCSACNGFQNRFKLPLDTPCPQTEEEFFNLRDAVFTQRRVMVAKSHAAESLFFESKPWEIAL